MSDIFEQEIIVDENRQEHTLFITYWFQGSEHFITSDGKIFRKYGEVYKEVPAEVSKEIFFKLNNMGQQDVTEFGEM